MKTVSVLLPCLNEEEALSQTVKTIENVFEKNNIDGEIIVIDNGSTDRSAAIAKGLGVSYVFESRRGYGRAYMAGFPHAHGTYIIMGDPDGSYDFNDLPRFLVNLTEFDVVLGSRFKGRILAGAMPALHRYVGNPIIKFVLYILHGVSVSEPSTGFIGIRRNALMQLALREPGMEFSSEMLVQIKKCNLTLREIPIIYHVRLGESKLRSWRDGLRHMRYLLKAKFFTFAQ